MAVKIIRQPKKIVLIGAPSSAAANAAGAEAAPQALRAAGIAARLSQIGYEVTDAGDIPVQTFQPDDNSPRARNVRPTVKSLEALQPHVERAVKAGALPIVLGGDCTLTIAVLAGIRRYYKEVSLIWCDSDVDMNTPATTPSGHLHGMVVAHIAGQGAAELVRFFKEPPLVREPDIAIFGLSRTDPGEQAWLDSSPMRKFSPAEIREMGAARAAEAALDRIHIFKRQWVLHFDVDVLAAEDMPATYYPAADGLRREEAGAALEVFLRNPNLAAVTLTSYVPSADADGAAAARLLDLFVGAMAARYHALTVVAEQVKEAEEVKELKEAAVEKEPGELAEAEPPAQSEEAKEEVAPPPETSLAESEPVLAGNESSASSEEASGTAEGDLKGGA